MNNTQHSTRSTLVGTQLVDNLNTITTSSGDNSSDIADAKFRSLLSRMVRPDAATPDNNQITNPTHEGIGKGIGETFVITKYPKEGVFEERGRWTGIILDKSGDKVLVRLFPSSNEQEDEEAEFSLSDLPESDQVLVEKGASFHWTIGVWKSIRGSTCQVSNIRLRRLPRWSNRDIVKANKIANEWVNLFE